jgi:hypothetical protein
MGMGSKNYFKRRRRILRQQAAGETCLVPKSWYEFVPTGTPGLTTGYQGLKSIVTREMRQTHFDACYGNIYTTDGKTNHMFISAMVGHGGYTSYTWVNLMTNRKWEESVDHTRLGGGWGQQMKDWQLVTKMEVQD